MKNNYDYGVVDTLKALSYLKDDEGKYYYIFPHHSPDGDTLGSAIAFNELLKYLGHKGKIVLDDRVPKTLAYLPKEDIVSSEDALSEVDYIFTLDCGGFEMFSEREHLIGETKLINIDHHATNTRYGDENYVFDHMSSTAEIIFYAYMALDIQMTSKSAEAIFTGIITDTGSFKYSNTTASTFMVASTLMNFGVNLDKMNVALFQNIPLNEAQLKQKVMSTLALYFDNRLGIVVLDQSLGYSFEAIKAGHTEGIVEGVRDIENISVAIFIKGIDQDTYKVSMRSKYDVDVSKIASQFNGGGHVKASGFKVEGSIEDIINRILIEVKKQMI